MINDILHSHVGDFNIWSYTDNFVFSPIALSDLEHLFIMQHIHTGSAFFCVETFGTSTILKGRLLHSLWFTEITP